MKAKSVKAKVHLHEREAAAHLLSGSEPGDVLRRLLRMENRLMAPFTVHVKKRYKISLNEFRLLMLIGRLGVTASHELAELAGVNTMMVSRGVAVLERHGRIYTGVDPRNLRRKVLRLTPKGHSLYQKMLPHTDELAKYMFETMSSKEICAFDATIVAITQRLEAIDAQGNSIFLQRTTPERSSR
jgi:DNA-binding MarR family transcriptional regulator